VANKYLAREDALFDDKIWDILDQAMKEAAASQLVGRRLLDVEGPFGIGLKGVPMQDEEMDEGLFASRMLPLLLIQREFELGTRDLASYEREGVVLDTCRVGEVAVEVARVEDNLIFNGTPDVPGLLTAEGVNSRALSNWDEVGVAANDVIDAITALDDAGFHGPYSLALAPERYNLLFRLYPQGRQSELDHLKTMVTEGIFKTPILQEGGVLLAAKAQCASIILGQDMSIGYIGPAGDQQEFSLSESLTVRIRQPAAICVLNG
jgi:uncharacterized linocin/CFP29 family protein